MINYIIGFHRNCLYKKYNNLSLWIESHVLSTNISVYYTIPWWIKSILKRCSKKIIVIPLKTSCTDCIWKCKSSLWAAWISYKAHWSEWKDCHWLYWALCQATWLEILGHWFQLKICVSSTLQIIQQEKIKSINQMEKCISVFNFSSLISSEYFLIISFLCVCQAWHFHRHKLEEC